jgi:hypothetical protein
MHSLLDSFRDFMSLFNRKLRVNVSMQRNVEFTA